MASKSPPLIFTYEAASSPVAYMNALIQITEPGGQLVRYEYYTGSKLIDPGTGHPAVGVYPVMCIARVVLPQAGTIQSGSCKSIYYSFDSWAWDDSGSATYAQFNYAKEYPGAPFDPSVFAQQQFGFGSMDSPYGHTTSYFFTGQPSTTPLINCSPSNQVLNSRMTVRGKLYRRDVRQQLQLRQLHVISSPQPLAGLTTIWAGSSPAVVNFTFTCSGFGSLLVNIIDSAGETVGSKLYHVASTSAQPTTLVWSPSLVGSSSIATIKMAALTEPLLLHFAALQCVDFPSMHFLFDWSPMPNPSTQALAATDMCGICLLYTPPPTDTIVTVSIAKTSGSSPLTISLTVPAAGNGVLQYLFDTTMLPHSGMVSCIPPSCIQAVRILSQPMVEIFSASQWIYFEQRFVLDDLSGIIAVQISSSEPGLYIDYIESTRRHPERLYSGPDSWAFIDTRTKFAGISISAMIVGGRSAQYSITLFKARSALTPLPCTDRIDPTPATSDLFCDLQSCQQISYWIYERVDSACSLSQVYQVDTFKDRVWSSNRLYYDYVNFCLPMTQEFSTMNPSVSSVDASVYIRRQFVYAAERYPGLRSANALSAVLQQNLYSSTDDRTYSVIGSQTNLWTQIGDSFFPSSNVILRNMQAPLASGYNNNQFSSDWLIESSILSRSDLGLPLSSRTLNGYQTSSVLRPAINTLQASNVIIATCKTARFDQNQCGCLGFEWYEYSSDGGVLNFAGWTLSLNSIVSTTLTGPSSSFVCPANSGASCIGSLNTTQTVWCRPKYFSAKPGVQYQISAWFRFNSNADGTLATIGMYDIAAQSFTRSSTLAPLVSHSIDRWMFLQCLISSSDIAAGCLPQAQITNGWIDDVSFSPVDGHLTITVFDDLLRPIQELDGNGGYQFRSYDFFGNTLVRGIMSTDNIEEGTTFPGMRRVLSNVTLTQQLSSRAAQVMLNGSDEFAPDNPNISLSMQSLSRCCLWEDFYNGESAMSFTRFALTSHQLSALPSVLPTNYASSILAGVTLPSGNLAVFAEIWPKGDSYPGSRRGIGVWMSYKAPNYNLRAFYDPRGDWWTGKPVIRLTVGSERPDEANEIGKTVLEKPLSRCFGMLLSAVTLDTDRIKLTVYVDGFSVLSCVYDSSRIPGVWPPAPNSFSCGVISSLPNGSVRSFGLFSEPLISSNFTNGAIDHMQSQFPAATGPSDVLAVQTLYNPDYNIPIAATRLTQLSIQTSSGSGFLPDFAVSNTSDPSQLVDDSLAVRAWSSGSSPMRDPSRPHSSSMLPEGSPDLRPSFGGSGGIFAAKTENTLSDITAIAARTLYVDTTGLTHFFNNSAVASFNTLRRTMQTPGATPVIQSYHLNLTNGIGLPFASIQRDFFSSNPASGALHTFQERDASLRPTVLHYPKAFVYNNFFWPTCQPNGFFTRSSSYGDRNFSNPRPDDLLLSHSDDADSGYRVMNYDSYHRLRIQQDGNGRSISPGYVHYWKYDGLDRVTEVGTVVSRISGGNSWNQFNLPSNLDSSMWPQDSTSIAVTMAKRFQYDTSTNSTSLGRLVQATTGDGVATTHKYNSLGQLTQVVNSSSSIPALYTSSVTYQYDSLGRMSSVTSSVVVQGQAYAIAYHITYGRDGKVAAISESPTGPALATYAYSNSPAVVETLAQLTTPLQTVRTTNDNGALAKLATTQVSDGTLLFAQHISYAQPRAGAETLYHPDQIIRNTSLWPTSFPSASSVPAPLSESFNYTYDGFERLVRSQHFSLSVNVLSFGPVATIDTLGIQVPNSFSAVSVVFLRATFASQSYVSVISFSFDGGVTYPYSVSVGSSPQSLVCDLMLDADVPLGITSLRIKSDIAQPSTLTDLRVSQFDPVNTSSFLYDMNSNLTSVITGNTTETFGYKSNCNQCMSRGAVFDNNGNIVNYQTKSITYDKSNGRLQSCMVASRFKYSAYFDAFDRKVCSIFTYDGVIQWRRQYIYGAGTDPLTEIYEAAGSLPVVTFYIYGPFGLLSYRRFTSHISSTLRYVIKDHLDSVRATVGQDATGALLVDNVFNYRPFGDPLAGNNNWYTSNSDFNYQFTSREWEPTLGLYNFKARMYDPTAARFLSPDLIHQFASPYIYSPSPVTSRDTSGFSFIDILEKIDSALSASMTTPLLFAEAAVVDKSKKPWVYKMEPGAIPTDASMAHTGRMTLGQFYSPRGQPFYRIEKAKKKGVISGRMLDWSRTDIVIPSGHYIWIEDTDRNFNLALSKGNQDQKDPRASDFHFKHSQLASGAHILGAGHMYITDGVITYLDNSTGHYAVEVDETHHPNHEAAKHLRQLGYRVLEAGIIDWAKDPDTGELDRFHKVQQKKRAKELAARKDEL